jgi:NAD(P)H-dependent FMN reductase
MGDAMTRNAVTETAEATESVEIGVIVGSTRPGRKAPAVAQWVHEEAGRHPEASVRILDIADFDLPLLDEPRPAITGQYERPHTRAWAAAIQPLDAFVFVSPEYNRSIPAALKNAIDFLYAEWGGKAAGFVSYGADAGGARAVEHLRAVMAELHVATVRDHVALTIGTDFADGAPAPSDRQTDRLRALLDELIAWGRALRTVRDAERQVAA